MNVEIIDFLTRVFEDITKMEIRHESNDFDTLCYPYATARVARINVLGIDNSLYAQNAGGDFDHTAVGRREFVWSIRAVGECSDMGLAQRLDSFRLRLQTDPYVHLLSEYHLGVADPGAITVVPPMPHASLQVVNLDMTFSASHEIEIGEEYAIHTVALTSGLKKSDGSAAPAAFSKDVP